MSLRRYCRNDQLTKAILWRICGFLTVLQQTFVTWSGGNQTGCHSPPVFIELIKANQLAQSVAMCFVLWPLAPISVTPIRRRKEAQYDCNMYWEFRFSEKICFECNTPMKRRSVLFIHKRVTVPTRLRSSPCEKAPSLEE